MESGSAPFSDVELMEHEENATPTKMGRRLVLAGGLSLVLARLWSPGVVAAQTAEGERLRARSDSLLDGRIRATARRGRDGRMQGQAYGLVDASFPHVMRALCDLPVFGSIIPTARSVRVLARERGRGHLELRGEAPLVGGYQILANARIIGHTDGTHSVSLDSADRSREMRVRIVLSRTPGRVRTIVGATIELDPRTLPAIGSQRVHRNAAIGTIAGLRREVHRRGR